MARQLLPSPCRTVPMLRFAHPTYHASYGTLTHLGSARLASHTNPNRNFKTRKRGQKLWPFRPGVRFA